MTISTLFLTCCLQLQIYLTVFSHVLVFVQKYCISVHIDNKNLRYCGWSETFLKQKLIGLKGVCCTQKNTVYSILCRTFNLSIFIFLSALKEGQGLVRAIAPHPRNGRLDQAVCGKCFPCDVCVVSITPSLVNAPVTSTTNTFKIAETGPETSVWRHITIPPSLADATTKMSTPQQDATTTSMRLSVAIVQAWRHLGDASSRCWGTRFSTIRWIGEMRREDLRR